MKETNDKTYGWCPMSYATASGAYDVTDKGAYKQFCNKSCAGWHMKEDFLEDAIEDGYVVVGDGPWCGAFKMRLEEKDG